MRHMHIYIDRDGLLSSMNRLISKARKFWILLLSTDRFDRLSMTSLHIPWYLYFETSSVICATTTDRLVSTPRYQAYQLSIFLFLSMIHCLVKQSAQQIIWWYYYLSNTSYCSGKVSSSNEIATYRKPSFLLLATYCHRRRRKANLGRIMVREATAAF